MGDLVRLCEEELKMEEEEVRQLLPASATLHNCLLLSLNKVAAANIETDFLSRFDWHF